MIPRRALASLGLASLALLGTASLPVTAASSTTRVPDDTIGALGAEYMAARIAPGHHVSADALLEARAAADAMAATGGPWKEQTTVPYQAQPKGYNAPNW